jgi:hypothetical protein
MTCTWGISTCFSDDTTHQYLDKVEAPQQFKKLKSFSAADKGSGSAIEFRK